MLRPCASEMHTRVRVAKNLGTVAKARPNILSCISCPVLSQKTGNTTHGKLEPQTDPQTR